MSHSPGVPDGVDLDYLVDLEERRLRGDDLTASELEALAQGRENWGRTATRIRKEFAGITARYRALPACDRRRFERTTLRQARKHPVFTGMPRTSSTTPAPRPRGAGRPAGRPRAAATRSSAASGDSGSDDPGESEPPSRRLTFADLRLAGALAGIPPHRQLRFFHALPEQLRVEAWSALAEEAGR